MIDALAKEASSSPRRRGPISCRFTRNDAWEMGSRLRGNDDLESSFLGSRKALDA